VAGREGGSRSWNLNSSLGGTINSYPSRRAAEAARESGPFVTLWEQEGRWMRGEAVPGWRPYAEVLAERAAGWMPGVAKDVMSYRLGRLSDAMLARGEDITDPALWRLRAGQLDALLADGHATAASASAGGGAAAPGPAATQQVTVTVWHNVAADAHGQPAAAPDGYRPGDPLVLVYAYQADPAGRTPDQLARDALAALGSRPRDPDGADLAWDYQARRLRPLNTGDVVAVAGTPFAVTNNGPAPVPAPLTEARTREHGTRPLPPAPARGRRTATAAPPPEHEAT
jgi:hypothetical protein